MRIIIFITIQLVLYYLPQSIAQERIVFDNIIFDSNVKTVQLYPSVRNPQAQTMSPVISIKSNQLLRLSFDVLYDDAVYYKAKLIHCNSDWTKSQLADLEFLDTYNEFDIESYDYSFDTKVEYVHYGFEIPKPKLPGNYVLIVYPEGDENAKIFSRRFLVYSEQVIFTNENGIMSAGQYSRTKQQLMFSINYERVEITNPLERISVTILQNHRWDNAKQGIPPTFVKPDRYTLEFQHFSDLTTFPAGNEFRYFDLRSIKFFGQYISHIDRRKEINRAWVEQDRDRGNLAYTLQEDIDGSFIIDNIENRNPIIENDYLQVMFSLKTQQIQNPVYIVGAFNAWEKTDENKMRYDNGQQAYISSILLKQGWYNYQYIVDNKNQNRFEGDWNTTQNIYEFFVYYRPIQLQADLLVGYLSLDFNPYK